MNFFGYDKGDDYMAARDRVSNWLQTKDEELNNTSLAKLSHIAAAELDIPAGTAAHALYKLRDEGALVRAAGTRSNGDFVVVRHEARKRSNRGRQIKVTTPEEKPVCAQKEPEVVSCDKDAQSEPKVSISKDGKTLNINISISIEA